MDKAIKRIDKNEVLRRAKGNWREILTAVGIPSELLDGRGHGCPLCGGTDRFSFTNKDADGSAHCRHCLKTGDGLAVVQWFNGETFPQAVERVAALLGMETGAGIVGTLRRPYRTPASIESKAKEKKENPPITVDKLSDLFKGASFVYEYPTAERLPRLAVGRYENADGSKRFMQARFIDTGGGGWIFKGLDPAPLYRLPQLEADNKSGPLAEPYVVITEGEKCAEALAGDEFFMIATTSAGGSGAPSKTDWRPLVGRHVVIIPDRDEPGEKYAAKVADLLFEVGALSVRIVRLESGGPETPSGFDVVDWIAEGGTVSALRLLIDSEKSFNPFGSEGATAMANELKNLRPVIVDRLLREGETINIVAPSKTGKSWLSLDLAMAVALGEVWLGEFETTPGRVLLIDNELHKETLAKRIRDVAAARNRCLDELGAAGLEVKTTRGGLTDIVKIGEDLIKYVRPGQYKVIILDALYRFLPAGVSENDNAQMMEIYNLLDSIALELGCAFVVIHHSNKGSQSGKAITDVGAGAGSIGRATDSHLIIRKHDTEGLFVIDRAARSFPPMEAVTTKFTYPLWEVVEDTPPTLSGEGVSDSAGRRASSESKALEILEAAKSKSKDPAGLFTRWNLQSLSGYSSAKITWAIDIGLAAGVLIPDGSKDKGGGKTLTLYRFKKETVGH